MSSKKLTWSELLGVLKRTFSEWMEDNALRLSAALAYYSIFSIAPLVVIAIAITGWFIGHEAAQGMLNEQLKGLLGAKAAEGVQSMAESASKPSSSVLAGIMGGVALLFGAAGVFGQLKDALNTIWEVRAKPGQGVMGFIREKVLSFGMVLVVGFLLLTSLFLTTAFSAVGSHFGGFLPEAIAHLLTFLISFAAAVALFAAIFKVLPDAEISWSEVWIGAGVTAFLFEIGKFLLGMYLGREGTASPYGAAGSAVLLLLWVYYASLILLFGAEFTQVYAQARGSRIQPSANAEPMTPEARAQQGLETGGTPGPLEPTSEFEPPSPARENLTRAFGHRIGVLDETLGAPDVTMKSIALKALGALAGGFVVGILTRRAEPSSALTPGEEIKHGSRALAAAIATAGAAYLSRFWSGSSKLAKESAGKLESGVQYAKDVLRRH